MTCWQVSRIIGEKNNFDAENSNGNNNENNNYENNYDGVSRRGSILHKRGSVASKRRSDIGVVDQAFLNNNYDKKLNHKNTENDENINRRNIFLRNLGDTDLDENTDSDEESVTEKKIIPIADGFRVFDGGFDDPFNTVLRSWKETEIKNNQFKKDTKNIGNNNNNGENNGDSSNNHDNNNDNNNNKDNNNSNLLTNNKNKNKILHSSRDDEIYLENKIKYNKSKSSDDNEFNEKNNKNEKNDEYFGDSNNDENRIFHRLANTSTTVRPVHTKEVTYVRIVY